TSACFTDLPLNPKPRPDTESITSRPGRGSRIVACRGSTARSARWTSLSERRPMLISIPWTTVSRAISRPSEVRDIWRILKLILPPFARSPVKEDRDDVRRQRRNQRERDRHMHIQPDFQQPLDPKMPPHSGKDTLLALQQ